MDVITCVGAGMTVKFFPLFFKNNFNLSPVFINLLFSFYLFNFAFFTFILEKFSKQIGRIPASMIFSIAGTICLFTLGYIESLPLLILVFILRGSFQNSIYPIDRSILMDHVPNEQRGRWSAVESIAQMTWSGSAVIGGYLIDSNDYRYTFIITGFIYLASFCLRIPLLWLVKE